MQQPEPTAGRALPRFRGALALSVLAHGLALAGWFYVHQALQGPASIGQKRGSLSVRLLTTSASTAPLRSVVATRPDPSLATRTGARQVLAHPQTEAAVLASTVSVSPKTADALMPISPITEQPVLAEAAMVPASSASQAQMASTQATPANPVAEPPGARFASLFAPIISRPLGRGRWSSAPMQPQMIPVAQAAAMQREQAIQGIRQALGQRVERMKADLRATPLAQSCDIAISLERQSGQVRCQQPQDVRWVSAQLSDLLTLQPGSLAMAGDNCLRVASSDLSWVNCGAPQPDP